MAIQHKDIPEDGLHEPKGTSLANSGEVYIADGAGSGSWGALPVSFTNIKEVTSLADFPDPVGGVITLEGDTGYYISGTVDISPNRIDKTNMGSALIGLNRATDALVSDVAGALISSSNVNVVMQGFTLINTNASGTLLDLTNTTTNICLLDKMIFGECNSIGSITSYANVIFDNCGLGGAAMGGVTFIGTFTELIIRDSSYQNWTGTLYDLGSAVFSFINVSGARFFGSASTQAFNGLPSAGNISGLGTITGNLFSAMTNPVGNNIDHSDSGWFFSGNVGLQESGFVGFCSFVANATDTAVPGTGTWTKVAGITLADPSNERFTMSDNNELTFGGLLQRPVTIQANVSGEKTSGTDTIEFTVFKDAGSGFQIINSSAISRSDFSGTTRSLTVTLLDTANPGDKYSVFTRNLTSGDDVEIENLQFFIRG